MFLDRCVYVFLICLILLSCKDKVICPAFQSTYILDDSIREAYFSYFREDSLPKETPWVRKNKYGIMKRDPYWVKNYKLKTAPMENVLRPDPEEVSDEGEFYEEDFIVDSLDLEGDFAEEEPDIQREEPSDLVASADTVSAPVILDTSTYKEVRFLYGYKLDDNFNYDQVYYNKYFGEFLVDTVEIGPDPALMDSLAKAAGDTTSMLDSGNVGFFQSILNFFEGIFAKKDKGTDGQEEVEEEEALKELLDAEEEPLPDLEEEDDGNDN